MTAETMRRGVLLVVVFMAALSVAGRATGEIIDRLLAVVDGAPITQSDVAGASA